MPITRRRLLAVAASLSPAWVGCVRERALAVRRIRVSASRQLTMCSLYLAQELGYFRQAGLNVEIQDRGERAQLLPLMIGGEVDVAFLTLNPSFINAVGRGAPVRIVAGREMASPDCGDIGEILGRRQCFRRGFADLRELRGKRVAYGNLGSFTEFCLETQLSAVGLKREELTAISLRRNEAVTALAGGKIDALVAQVGLDNDLAVILPEIVRSSGLASIFPSFQYSFILFGKRLLEGDPADGGAFLVAYLRGARDFLKGKTPAFLEEFARSMRLDADRARRACRNTFTPDGQVDLESLRRYVAWAVQRGYCPGAVDPAQLVDSRFLAEARRQEQWSGRWLSATGAP